MWYLWPSTLADNTNKHSSPVPPKWDQHFPENPHVIPQLWSVFAVFREQVLQSEHEAFFFSLTCMILLRLFYLIRKKLI